MIKLLFHDQCHNLQCSLFCSSIKDSLFKYSIISQNMFGVSLSCLLLYVTTPHVASTLRIETEKNLLDQWLYISYTAQ